ncbi:MAG: bifunctional DNA-formamidopyrimidine glycosylase/DNA-(apurinic or apyrimidinic site) lyase [Ilumatobacteraceae bacterium]|nr:formamidopyrimidine-DNA glycosylase [Actinomycetes bacterium]
MPELPEVETVRRGIERRAVGRVIERVEVFRERTVRRQGREAIIDGLTGTRLVAARRRGKYLLCDLDSGGVLMMHLRMSGRVLVVDAGTARPPHTHVVMHLSPDANGMRHEMWFVDPRTFGEVVVFDRDDEASVAPELARLGPDPIVDGLDEATLAAILRGRRGNLKALLLDQHRIAGIGNIYADEILHRARLRHHRLPSRLDAPTRRRLLAAIHFVLRDAVEKGGSTLDDTQYVGIDGEPGWFQTEHRVYDRAGQRCLTCRNANIVRRVVAGRSTCFCPRCQH